MDIVVLTKKNCHRAAVIRRIDNPDLGDFTFRWRGEKINDNFFKPEFCHLAESDKYSVPSRIYDHCEDLKNWEVASWKYEVSLEELWDIACRAFNGTSFNPEERGAYYIRDYEATLNSDLQNIPQDEQEKYITKFKEWAHTLFDKHSRCLSSMITGPANFPTRRNEKANNSYDNAVTEFGEWRERAQKAIAKRIEEAKPAEQKAEEEWTAVKRDIDTCYLTTNLYNRLETVAKRGNVELMERTIAYVRELNSQRKSPLFTERHKFFKLAELAGTFAKMYERKASIESTEVYFEGGKVVKNFSEDRLQIIFDSKPDYDTISNLKKNGFRWSPRFGAWQRQLTVNAYDATARVIPVTYEQLKNM